MGFCGQKCTFTFVSLMKTIACMTVLKVVDDSIYCSRLVMDCLQGYEHDFHSRQFKETFSPQREAENLSDCAVASTSFTLSNPEETSTGNPATFQMFCNSYLRIRF